MMKSWDAIVVGGGPAGLAAGIALRQKGLRVLVADALKPPIDKACGEGLMPDSRRELAQLGIDLRDADGVEFEGIHFASHVLGGNSDSGHSVTGTFRAGRGLGVRRLHLHAQMVQRASEIGVELAWGSRVELIAGCPLRIDGRAATSACVIGADGQSSRVRQWAGMAKGRLISRRFGFRQHYRTNPWSRHVEVHWGARGQLYVTPVAEDEVGIAALTRFPGLTFDDILQDVPFLRQKLESTPVSSTLRGSITTTRKFDRVTAATPAGSVALIGDASGSADAITGEGLAMAFRQALLLADSIYAGGLDRYQAGHAATLKLPQDMARVMLAMDRWTWFRDRAMHMLAADPAMFARMLAVHLGEESIESFLLHRGCRLAWRMIVPASTLHPSVQGPLSGLN